MASRKLTVDLVGNNRNLHRTLDSTESRMGRFQGRAKSFGVGVAAGVASAFAVDKILGFGSSLMTLGTQMQVAGIKADTVFGDSADGVRKWADELNESMGLSDEALTGLAANMGDLLKPMGFTSDEAANMSMEMLDLSGALSAWSGGTVGAAQAAEIMSKALLGERDGLIALGIDIKQAEIDAWVLKNTTGDLTDEQLKQAEASATQALLFEKSTDAQAAWADGSMDGVKAQNELRAAWADAQVFLAEKFLPILETLFQYGKNVIDFAKILKAAWDINGFQGVIDVLGHWFENVLKPKLGEWVEGIRVWAVETGLPLLQEGLVVLGTAFWSWLTNTAIPATGDMLGKAWDRIAQWVAEDGLVRLGDAVHVMADKFWTWMNGEDGAIAKIDENMRAFLDGINAWILGEGSDETESSGGSFASGLWRGFVRGTQVFFADFLWRLPEIFNEIFVNALRALGGALVDFGAGMGRKILDALMEVFGGLGERIGGVIHGVSSFSLGDLVPDIMGSGSPGNRSGGRAGPRFTSRSFTTADMAEAAAFTGGTTVHITVNAGMGTSGRAVGEEIAGYLETYVRTGGRVVLSGMG